MSIEATLERIAVALEAIASSKALPVSGNSETKTPESKVGSAAKTEIVAGQKTRPNSKTADKPKVEEPKVEEEKVETITEDVSFESDLDTGDAEPPKWADVNKELFAMLTAVTEAKGRPAAQDLYTTFKTKYANGEKITEGSVKPGLYSALLAEVRGLAGGEIGG